MTDERIEHFNANLKFYETEYNNGDVVSLFKAYEFCVTFKLDMPEWVTKTILISFQKIINFEVRTLDEAFGFKRKKWLQIKNERNWRDNAFDIYRFVLNWERQGKSINFAEIAKKLRATGLDGKNGIKTNKDEVYKMYTEIRENTQLGRVFELKRKEKKP